MFSRSKKELAPSPAHVRPMPPADPPAKRLPEGAEAALWAIVEVMPDPRNHLALTRDPTCEVRLTPAQLAEARASIPDPGPAPTSTPTPAVAPPPSAPPLARRQRQIARRADVRWSEDTAEVRLPAIASPDELSATPIEPGDAAVHTLDPPAPTPTRWAEGA